MGVSAVLRPGAVTVDPGRDARCHVLIRNTGQIVDQFLLVVVGDVRGWSTLRPETVNLLPNEETAVDLLLAPPMTYQVLAGEHPFAIRVVSREDIAGSIVYEGTATVTEFVQLNVEIVPHTSRGRRTGRHTLVVDNVGNFPLKLDVRPTDPDALLNFRVRPRAPVTQPGTATMIKVKARPVTRFWRGADRHMPFTVTVVPEQGKAISVDAAMNQKPLLPRRFFLLMALLLVLLFLLVIVITTLLQKQPVSMAGPSPAIPSTSPTTAPTTATTTVATTSASAPAGGGGAPGAGAPGGQGGPAGGGGSTDFTIDANAFPGSPGTAQTFSYVMPAGRRIRLLSVRFTDAQRDAGSLQVRLDGTALASFNLADVPNLTYRFPGPPVANGGQLVTLAVSCADAATPCAIIGDFATGPAS